MYKFSYQLYTLTSLALYGLWGFFGAKTASILPPKIAIFFSGLGSALIGILCLALVHFKVQTSFEGSSLAMLTGASTGLGTIFFIAALQKGPSIPVVMITALYPMITILLLCIFNHDQLSTHQIIGVILSMIALVFLNLP